MKPAITILISLLASCQLFGWHAYGPVGIGASDICFDEQSGQVEMICSTNGMYVWTADTETWQFYTIDSLPVHKGIILQSHEILLIAGNGSDADGIYLFDIATGVFTLMKPCDTPHFLIIDRYTNIFYAGFEGGLLHSSDGDNWEEFELFKGLPVWDMAARNDLLLVSAAAAKPFFRSEDGGLTWHNTTKACLNMVFYGDTVFGILPGTSYSSGLYNSILGNNWEVSFWSMHLSDVLADELRENVFVSWYDPDKKDGGIAHYEPGNYPGVLTYLDEGLPDKNVRKITLRSQAGGYELFVCTDSGVYGLVITNIRENEDPSWVLCPNPVRAGRSVRLHVRDDAGQGRIRILDLNGRLIFQDDLNRKQLQIHTAAIPPGVYLFVFQNGRRNYTKKLVIQ